MSLEERLLRRFTSEHPGEAGKILGGLPPKAAAAVLAGLPDRTAAGVLLQMPFPGAVAALEGLEPAGGAALLSRVAAAQAAALLRRVRPDLRERLLGEIDDGAALRPLLVFPEGTAAALMDPQVPALPGESSPGEARQRLGRVLAHLALEVYVVDSQHRLQGFVELGEVLEDRRAGTLAALARPVEPLPAAADAQSVGAHPGWGERGTLPVVDERGAYLGAVRAERLRQAMLEADARHARAGLEAAQALGGLYRLGIGGIFTGLGSRREGERG